MGTDPSAHEIRKVAKELDDAIEGRDIESVLSFFSDECEIEMLGLTLKGKDGARKWLEWLFSTFDEISFKPVTIIVDGNTFFEEFVMSGRSKKGAVIMSKQSEVLVYDDLKVRSLRIYFDRLDFADVIGGGPVKRKLVKVIKNISLKELK